MSKQPKSFSPDNTNFHKRQFKAYLALRGMTKADVARKIGMHVPTFESKSLKSNSTMVHPNGAISQKRHYFTNDECLLIAKTLHISEKWQRRIFSKVILK